MRVLVVLGVIALGAGAAPAARCKPMRGRFELTIKADALLRDWADAMLPILCRTVSVPEELTGVELGSAPAGVTTGAAVWKRFVAALAAHKLKVAQKKGLWVVSGLPPAVAGVRRLSATSYQVERAVIDAALADPMALASQVMIALVVDDDGNGAGYELTTVDAGSLPARLGLRRGDVIEVVNGRAISGPGDAMAAVQALRSASKLVVRVSSYGEPRTMTYTIR